jgi:hypothetical protein
MYGVLDSYRRYRYEISYLESLKHQSKVDLNCRELKLLAQVRNKMERNKTLERNEPTNHKMNRAERNLEGSQDHLPKHTLPPDNLPNHPLPRVWKDLTILKFSMVPPGSKIISVQPGVSIPKGAIPISLTMEERISLSSLVPQSLEPFLDISSELVPGLRLKLKSIREPVTFKNHYTEYKPLNFDLHKENPFHHNVYGSNVSFTGSIFSPTEKEFNDSDYSTLDSDVQIQLPKMYR